MKNELNKLSFIDSLRGLSILGVVAVHSSQVIEAANKALHVFMASGSRGVQLFYIASALTLCRSWSMRSPFEASPVRNFFIRRIFRIAPLFYMAIMCYLFLIPLRTDELLYWAPSGIQSWYIPVTFLFLHGLHPETINSIVPGSWSIAVEVAFYAVFPWLITRIERVGSCMVFLAVSIIVLKYNVFFVNKIYHFPSHAAYLVDVFSSINFFGQLPVFALGILAFRLISSPNLSVSVNYLKCIACFSFIEYYIPAFGGVGVLTNFLPDYVVASIGFLSLSVIMARQRIYLFDNRFFVFFGRLSYSIYLCHFAIISLLKYSGAQHFFPKSNVGSLLFFVTALASTLPAAIAAHRFIEQPFIRLGGFLIKKLEKS